MHLTIMVLWRLQFSCLSCHFINESRNILIKNYILADGVSTKRIKNNLTV